MIAKSTKATLPSLTPNLSLLVCPVVPADSSARFMRITIPGSGAQCFKQVLRKLRQNIDQIEIRSRISSYYFKTRLNPFFLIYRLYLHNYTTLKPIFAPHVTLISPITLEFFEIVDERTNCLEFENKFVTAQPSVSGYRVPDN